jgi:hypothetical protein
MYKGYFPSLSHAHFLFYTKAPHINFNVDGRGYLANAKKYVCPSCKGVGKVSICLNVKTSL